MRVEIISQSQPTNGTYNSRDLLTTAPGGVYRATSGEWGRIVVIEESIFAGRHRSRVCLFVVDGEIRQAYLDINDPDATFIKTNEKILIG